MAVPAETEYQTLRDEIISEMEMQTNLRIAMCTIAAALLALAVEQGSPDLCLTVFGVLIPFRLLIHSKQAGILRISAYLMVKYEGRYQGLAWESLLAGRLRRTSDRTIRRFAVVSSLGYYVATIFGIMATAGYLLPRPQVLWYHMAAAAVCMLAVVVLDFAFNGEKLREAYRREFQQLLYGGRET